ncbi:MULTISPECIES: tetratricopeptide repeat protein [Streptomyces]|uniref:tetratricopeptide repeat protein n=1 Tax=Streptomyces TaxID=1883 RepID=UPI00131D9E49|nr:tetratricopeptide repeat protein [Streptomyces virginiae]
MADVHELIEAEVREGRAAQGAGDPVSARKHLATEQELARVTGVPATTLARVTRLTEILTQDTGNLKAAETHSRTALDAIADANTSSDVDLLLLVQQHLGSVFSAQGRYVEAEHMLRAALEQAEREGAHGSAILSFRNELGMVCKYTGKFTEAEKLYRQALAETVELFGPDHSHVASIYHNIAGLAHARNDFAGAEEPARKGIEIRMRALGEDDIAVAADQAALAPILLGLGKLDEAEELLDRILDRYLEHYGEDYSEVAYILHNLASVAHMRGDHECAVTLFGRALASKERTLGPQHPSIGLTLHNLAIQHELLGHGVEAEEAWVRARNVLQTQVDPTHPALAAVTDALARLNSEANVGDRK